MNPERKRRVVKLAAMKLAANEFPEVPGDPVGYQARMVSPVATRLKEIGDEVGNFSGAAGRRLDDILQRTGLGRVLAKVNPIERLGEGVYGKKEWRELGEERARQKRQFEADDRAGKGYGFGPSVSRALDASQMALQLAPMVPAARGVIGVGSNVGKIGVGRVVGTGRFSHPLDVAKLTEKATSAARTVPPPAATGVMVNLPASQRPE